MGISSLWRDPNKFKFLIQMPLHVLLSFVALPAFALTWYVGMTNWLPQLNVNWWEAEFIGPLGFVMSLNDKFFMMSIVRTLVITGVVVPVEFALGFLLAYVFMANFFGKKILTLIAIVPMMVVPAAGGYIIYLMFVKTGPINGLLGLIGIAPIPILTNQINALIAIMLADIWQWTPFIFLIMSAALLGLPQDPINAAYVLGASKFYTFRTVVLPMLKRPILIALILRFIESLKIFDYPYMMTGGGPGFATQTVSMYLYENGFRYLKYGPTAGQSLMILIAIGIAGRWIVKPLRAAQRGE